MFSRIKVALIAGAASLAAAAPASAGVIFYDSFESPDVASWAVFQTGVGDNPSTWDRVDGAGIEIQDESIGITDAYDGEQYVELDSDTSRGGIPDGTNSAMAVNVPMVAGQQYEISFAYKPRTNNGSNDNGIKLWALTYDGVNFSNEVQLLAVSERTSTLSDWFVYSVIYTAQTGIDAIGFSAFGRENSLGGFLDAVQVSEVPLPAALPLFGFGVAGIAALRRRKRQAA